MESLVGILALAGGIALILNPQWFSGAAIVGWILVGIVGFWFLVAIAMIIGGFIFVKKIK